MQGKRDQILQALQRDLRALLTRPGYTQELIAKEAELDQPVVSRAKNGELKRVTPRVRKLCVYVERELGDITVPTSILKATRAYLSSGGDPDLLCESINLLVAAGRPTR